MPAIIKNENGLVSIENEVIARVAGLAALDSYGVVGMAALSKKDGIVHLLKKDSLTKGIKVASNEDGSVNIELHIIVEYGTNISAIADNLIDTVNYKVHDMLGITVGNIQVFVEGIRTENHDD